jgi:chemotaxis protein MotB
MSEPESRRPIVVRRRHVSKAPPHGTWKIAYADFMTAMMAFFLVMWLIGGLSNIEIQAVSKYFRTPLKVALVGGDQSTASDSAIPGGGDDPVHAAGAVALTRPRAKNYQSEHRQLQQLKAQLMQMIHKDPKLNELASQIQIELVADGLRIQIFDNRRRPMFALGSARIEPYIKTLLEKIAPQLNTLPNKMTLTGHTDDLPYASGARAYSNWELSADRANAARRALVAGGIHSGKLLRVIGAAATRSVPGDKPGAPVNRRISILVLNKAAQRRIESQGQETVPPAHHLSAPSAIEPVLQAHGKPHKRTALVLTYGPGETGDPESGLLLGLAALSAGDAANNGWSGP